MIRQDAVLIGAEIEENLALRYLGAAAAAAGFSVELLPYNSASDAAAVAEAALRRHPRLVGLSMTFQAGVPAFLSLARELRARGFQGHLTAGGQFATVSASRLLELEPALDSVVRGEGEDSLVALLRAVGNGGDLSGILGLTYHEAGGASGAASKQDALHEKQAGNGATLVNPPRPAVLDLDVLPRPVRTPPFGRQAGLPVASMLAGRGCLQGCTYCSIQTFGRQRPGPRQRRRIVAEVVDEMSDLYRDHGVRIFVFHDDNFLCATERESADRASSFAREIRGRGLHHASLVIKIRPDIVTDEVVAHLVEAGVVRAYVGIESGNPHGLKVLGRGHGVDANHRALDAFERGGLFACYNLLAFHPETTMNDLREDLAFVRAHPAVPLNVGRVEIYAGTPLERWLRRQNRLWGPELAPQYRIRDPRAELASRIMTAVFHRRAFGLEGLLNAASSLGYEPAALSRAWPELDPGPVVAETRALLRRITVDTCDALEDICRLVESDAGDPRRIQEGVSELSWSVARRDADLEARVRAVREELLRVGKGN